MEMKFPTTDLSVRSGEVDEVLSESIFHSSRAMGKITQRLNDFVPQN